MNVAEQSVLRNRNLREIALFAVFYPSVINTKKTGDLSGTTFTLILITCSCLLVRAIAIKELAFIFYYAFLIFVNSLQLFLIWRYKDRNITA